jgi:uncharacterized protein
MDARNGAGDRRNWITVAVYGVVALIVKADDLGLALAMNDNGSVSGTLSRAFGRALVLGMPWF